jgi:hypothetical protein
MSITRKLQSSGREVVFEKLSSHEEMEYRIRKEKVRNLLDEKFAWASTFVEMYQASSGVTKDELFIVESTLKTIDEELSLLGIVNY